MTEFKYRLGVGNVIVWDEWILATSPLCSIDPNDRSRGHPQRDYVAEPVGRREVMGRVMGTYTTQDGDVMAIVKVYQTVPAGEIDVGAQIHRTENLIVGTLRVIDDEKAENMEEINNE